MKWIILTFVLILGFSGIVSAETVLLEDDFNDGNADGWLEQLSPDLNGDAYWVVQNGIYAGTYSGSPAIASNGDNNWTNYSYEVDVLTNGFDSVVLFRFIDAYNHYDTSFNGNTLDLNRRVNGVYTHDLATVNIPNPPTLPYKYKIVVSGDNIKIYLSNVLYIDYTDVNSPLPKGRIAIGSWSGTREFDNVRVSSLESSLGQHVAALWHLDEGSGNIAHDETANNNDGTISGAVWVTGISGTALQIDNVDGYVNVADSDSLTFNGNFTIEASFKLSENHTAGSSNKWIMLKNGEYGLYLNGNNGNLQLYFSDSYQSSVNYFWKASIWYHVAGVHKTDDTWEIYVNGILDASSNKPFFTTRTDCNLDIGNFVSCTPFNHDNFVGVIDEVRISNIALHPSEFLLFQQEPTCTDGIQNGDEEGIDCGGSCPNICPVTIEERLEILEQKVGNLTEENQQQQQQIENLTQGQESLENQTQEHGERIGILEVAVSALETLVNEIQQTLNDFMNLMRSYLSHLPFDLKKGMICGHMFDNNLTNYSDLGLACTLNATAGCTCEGETPRFVVINGTNQA